ncbi:hypothetical protein HQN59_21330 [Schlegelella sp. ID0723]|uniref:DUF697 domain-containing protein n=1 Tax=Piscinibacter koreensis TaxID=2742824 RepID=A0A7Y6TYK3_9BURK|nr:hypothetical protein [Schlegelella koreensis]
MPTTASELDAVAQRCQAMVRRRALVAAGVAVVPVPGLDWLVDVGTVAKLSRSINEAFGLGPAQIARLAPNRREAVYNAISAGGGLLVGKLVTRGLVLRMLKLVGVRLTTQQAAKWVPIAGQAVSAALTYSALKAVCDEHIRQCIEVSRQLAQLPAPPAGDAAARADGAPDETNP